MAKVRTFSRVYPKGHFMESKPTFFVEKILNNIGVNYANVNYLQHLFFLNKHNISIGKLSLEQIEFFFTSLRPVEGQKKHTLRAGKHFKASDVLSPRCWSGSPYNTPQIILNEELSIKTCDVVFVQKDELLIVGENNYCRSGYNQMILELAKNDGLGVSEFKDWFKKPFDGQAICWEDVGY